MKKLVILLVFACSFALISCAGKMEKQSETADLIDESDQAKNQLANTPSTDLYSNGKTKLIKTVNYRFEVENVKKSAEAIELAIKKFPAYISSSDLRLENPVLEHKMTIRIQNEFFQDLLKEIDQQARFVNFREVKTEDVAKQFVDVESRLHTKREVEARYMEILRKKAGTIEELLQAEKQIGELHEEIEATISRINYLKDEVSYSTINLEFYQVITEKIAEVKEPPISAQFAKALATGWTALVNVVLTLAYIWPLLLLSVLCTVVFRYLKTRKMKTL